jgi:hypothetical protein
MKKAKVKQVPQKANLPEINMNTFSGALREVAENEADRAIQFVRLWRSLNKDEDAREAIVLSWPEPETGRGVSTVAKLLEDWYVTHLVGVTGFGGDLIRTIVVGQEEGATAEHKAAAETAATNLRREVQQLKTLRRVMETTVALRRLGFVVRFYEGRDKAYKPIYVANLREEKHGRTTRMVEANGKGFAVSVFLTFDPAKLKEPDMKALEKNRTVTKRKAKTPVATAETPAAAAQTMAKAAQVVAAASDNRKSNWNDDVIPVLSAASSVLADVTLPEQAKNGVNAKTPGYDVAIATFRRLGNMLTQGTPALQKVWRELIERLPGVRDTISPAAKPVAEADKPVAIPASVAAPVPQQATMHKATNA